MDIGTTVLVRDCDLHIRQGSTVPWSFRYWETDADGSIVPNTFAGWLGRAQIRDQVGGEVWVSMTVNLAAAANKLTVSGSVAAVTTEAAAWNSRNLGVWDLELVRADGSVIPFVAGRVIVDHDVTRV